MTPHVSLGRIVLAGFLGAPPEDVLGSPERYRTALYKFEGEAHPRESKFFSIALREFLRTSGRSPALWLIMGTSKSIWDTLLEAVPEAKRDEALENAQAQVSDALRAKHLQQSDLDPWGQHLSRCLDCEVVCFLVGEARDEAEQQCVWMAMEQHVEAGDEVIFDITHSLRHFPVIASFSVMLLRELRDVKKVDFYYGALELKEGDVSTVIHVPICQQLSEATQAVSTFKKTGSFRELGVAMQKVSPSLTHKARQVAFSDETNHPNSACAEELILELMSADFEEHSIEKALKNPLISAVNWVVRYNEVDGQMVHKAREAASRNQLFKATALLYEGLVSLSCRVYEKHHPSYRVPLPDTWNYFKHRKDSFYHLRTSLPKDDLTLERLELLRNAVLHGTLATHIDHREEINAALRDRQAYFEIFNACLVIYQTILNEEFPSSRNPRKMG